MLLSSIVGCFIGVGIGCIIIVIFYKMSDYFQRHKRIKRKPVGKIEVITDTLENGGYKRGEIVDYYGYSDTGMLVIKAKPKSEWYKEQGKYMVLFSPEFKYIYN